MKIKLPPQEEWDFRKVDRLLLREATHYEYARSTDKVRASLVLWLDTPLKGKTVRQHIIDALIVRQTEAKKLGREQHPYLPVPAWIEICGIGSALCPLWSFYYESILTSRPDFPRPWTGMNIKGFIRENFSRARIKPFPVAQNVNRSSESINAFLKHHEGDYLLSLDFYADGRLSTIDQIVKDFEKWLRGEVRRIKPRMPSGRNAQVAQRAYPLKCLAALRLRRAGLTYEAAANKLQTIAVTKEDAWFIPMFDSASSWTKAIKHAERTLSRFESGEFVF